MFLSRKYSEITGLCLPEQLPKLHWRHPGIPFETVTEIGVAGETGLTCDHRHAQVGVGKEFLRKRDLLIDNEVREGGFQVADK